MNDNLLVAHTILQQLGGSTFVVMTGCQTRNMDELSLTLSIPMKTKNKCNRMKVVLTPTDDYKVEFYSVRAGTTSKVKQTFEHIGCDQLRELLETETGLATHL